jgi:lysophospholipase L1-like esterase
MQKKNILLFGDSLTWGAQAGPDGFRFEKEERIAGVLQKMLGENFEVIEEGRPGRTVATDDEKCSRNGFISFENAVASHMPLDYIFIMLGTADIKKKFGERSAEEIVSGFVEYRNVIDAFNQVWEINFKPKVVIVAPPVIDQKYSSDRYQKDFIGSQKVSEQLADAYKKLTQEKSELNFDFLDASKVKVSESDGVHLEVEQNQEIAELYFDYIKQYESI